jgi:hypothetical protein
MMPAHLDVDPRRGWRIAFVLVHVAFMFMNVAALVSTLGQRTLTYATNWGVPAEQFEAIVTTDAWGTFGRLSLLAVGIYLAALIAHGDERVPRYYVAYGVALVAFEVLLNGAQIQLWGVPRGMTWISYASRVAVYVAALIGWVLYVSRSAKVRATFVHEPRAMSPMDRRLIGFGAIALIAWPFLLNCFVEASSVVAGLMSPSETSAASGVAEGILTISVATGLFVLMKNAWSMRNVWIAVLVPVCFAALTVAYTVQGFLLHWRF